jgi:anti-sigma28 factor (negative regulator of flagellin synthesis)
MTTKNSCETKNSERIERLKIVIKSGTYTVKSEVVAKALVQQLEAGSEIIH